MSIDRLRAHYGFSRMPFGKDLAPGMLHAHGAHAEAVARIQWCIAEQAIGVISGECGAGKTVAARAAVLGLDASRHTILYLGTPGVGLRGIYGLIITTLGGTPRFHHAALIPQAQELLAAEASERGKQVVLIIDEAHLLDPESLEGIRCLSNMGMDQTAPFCLLLLGQPTLRRRLRQGTFTALDQRIAVRGHAIAGLDAKETTSYVQHHRDRRPLGHPVLRRRDRPDRRSLTRPSPADQQPRRRIADRRVRRKEGDRRRVRHPHCAQRNSPPMTLSLLDSPPEDPQPTERRCRRPRAGRHRPHRRSITSCSAKSSRPSRRTRSRPRRDPD